MSRQSAYTRMLEHSSQLWHVVTPSLVAPFRVNTRDVVIEDALSIPEYFPTRDLNGHAVFGEPSYWSREKAERAADALGDVVVRIEEPANV
jgi:hypothetical protein